MACLVVVFFNVALSFSNDHIDCHIEMSNGAGIQPKKAIKKLYYPRGGDPKIVSGESGAAGLAGLLKVINNKELYELKSYLNLNKDSKILLFNTEGDTDENSFKKIISN